MIRRPACFFLRVSPSWRPWVLGFALLAAAGTAFHAGAYDRVTGRSFASRSEVIAARGMAATSQPLATQIALDILKQGGNAIDAAIAANAALVAHGAHRLNGMGGDLFAIVWDRKDPPSSTGLNGSGRSPMSPSLSRSSRSAAWTSVPQPTAPFP